MFSVIEKFFFFKFFLHVWYEFSEKNANLEKKKASGLVPLFLTFCPRKLFLLLIQIQPLISSFFFFCTYAQGKSSQVKSTLRCASFFHFKILSLSLSLSLVPFHLFSECILFLSRIFLVTYYCGKLKKGVEKGFLSVFFSSFSYGFIRIRSMGLTSSRYCVPLIRMAEESTLRCRKTRPRVWPKDGYGGLRLGLMGFKFNNRRIFGERPGEEYAVLVRTQQ